uniref:BHLH domain-containing protein n=1 Tax=Taeniopygia guttata TaxID=59729 RepID=A0A674HA62_TAEGU
MVWVGRDFKAHLIPPHGCPIPGSVPGQVVQHSFGVKSNPSKRHRERLNQELNKLMGLLPFPEDVRSRLDKLSILRLAVGYLKVKSYLMGECPCWEGGKAPGINPRCTACVLPQALGWEVAHNGFVITVTGDGHIFYISPTMQDYLGFHQVSTIPQLLSLPLPHSSSLSPSWSSGPKH